MVTSRFWDTKPYGCLPSKNDTARPSTLLMVANAVAEVRCSGGNHSADNAGGAPIAIGPAKPFRNWPV